MNQHMLLKENSSLKKTAANRKITLEQRKIIEDLLHKNTKQFEIAKKVGIDKSTLCRELKRCKEYYNAEEAHKNYYQSKNLIDWEIIGKRFGLLTVISYSSSYKKRSWWHCRCDCGKDCIISRKILTAYVSPRRPLSCGCIAKQGKGAGNKVPFEEASLRKFQDMIKFRKIEEDCWEWTGYKQSGKHPMTSWKSKTMGVRKCMYLIMNGTSYEPNPVFTTCGNLMCFNPDHITLERPKKRQFYG
jgi:hypothetical protein